MLSKSVRIAWVLAMLAMMHLSTAESGEVNLDGKRFAIPDGMTLERVAGPPLVDRPICADFDEQGRLYVADSSGSNAKVDVQLEERPHRIVRLEDRDGDGRFDHSTVFADRMMFPEGTLWHAGSLYVAAPPQIWKLTDTTGDGKADAREVWYDGKTLTGCANDLHGPYLGRDGWMYWCKGAFAEQVIERPGREPLRTRAAHIFRRHPDGGSVEPVMTGGMDNPVEVVFTPGGERIFTTTFLVQPAHGLRDGIIHAIYGGVYGKVHSVLDGHPRTGAIMPVLAHHGGASAPCGLVQLESDQLGSGYQHNLLACSFNMHKVIRHKLHPHGASYRTEDSDLLNCDDLDFHPTDILEDADGSLLVIDTGGWYKLCCPTSQLVKPDILGGIYRIRRRGGHDVPDARGHRIDWRRLSPGALIELLDDDRFAVRRRAQHECGNRGQAIVAAARDVVESSPSPRHRLEAVWALTRIRGGAAREAVRNAVDDVDETVRQAAMHSISVHRDRMAEPLLVEALERNSPANRRVAAEAVGRIGSPSATATLLATAADCSDRILEHSLIYAAIEIGDHDAVRASLAGSDPQVRRAASIALDQIGKGHLSADDIRQLLATGDARGRETAWWIAERRPAVAAALIETFRKRFARPAGDTAEAKQLSERLSRVLENPEIQAFVAAELVKPETDPQHRITILRAIQLRPPEELPEPWLAAVAQQLAGTPDAVLTQAVATIYAATRSSRVEAWSSRLAQIAGDSEVSSRVRLEALASIPPSTRTLNLALLQLVVDQLSLENSASARSIAIDVLASTTLDADQLTAITTAVPTTGSMELKRLMEVFTSTNSPPVGIALVDALGRSPVAASLAVSDLERQLATYGEDVLRSAQPLLTDMKRDEEEKLSRMEAILELARDGDVRRGQHVFHSQQAACIQCHEMGYLGGNVGPDLSRIGGIRSERDLLEAILFPSASFVRSYEPMLILTDDGKLHNGIIRDENEAEVMLQLDAEKTVRLRKETIEERRAGKVSIMPDGLDRQFTPQQLADLVAFLRQSK